MLTVDAKSSDGTLRIRGYRVPNSFERKVAVGEIRERLVRGHCRGLVMVASLTACDGGSWTQRKKKLFLVLDLDHTLIYANEKV